jgi:flagellar motility protein MotE (MotC chaperone)
MQAINEADERPYGLLTRLFFYAIPLIFAATLTGFLLTFFGYDVFRPIQDLARRIPFIEQFVPKAPANETADPDQEANEIDTLMEKYKSSEQLVAIKDKALADLTRTNEQHTKKIEQLQQQLVQAQNANKQKALEQQAYDKKISELAQLYAAMSPSKAAPILSSLTSSERVLVLDAMKPSERVAILEKMDADVAAAVTMQLKDVVPVQTRQIAALQERLATQQSSPTIESVSETYAQMDPKKAANVLLELSQTDMNKVKQIFLSLEAAPRAAIFDALADIDRVTTAKIAAAL